MKIIKSNILLVLLSIHCTILISCSEESKVRKENQSISESDDAAVRQNVVHDDSNKKGHNFTSDTKSILGIWKIDSIAENDTISVRALESFQCFVFKKDSSYAIGKEEYGRTNFNIIGNFSNTADSLLIFTKNGIVATRYGLETPNDTMMILRWNITIRNNIKRKPTLYLSKHSEIE